MDQNALFEQFLSTQSGHISLSDFIINLIIAAILGYVLQYIYIRFGQSLSNRKRFSHNFILVAVTTMVIISIVKSSLSLSLGLVGALSIVRFRTAIKEPEELAYLFLTITIGLGLGANQTLITILAFIFISIIIIISSFRKRLSKNNNMYLHITSHNKDVSLESVTKILEEHASDVSLKRYDKKAELFDVLFIVLIDNISLLEKIKSEMDSLDSSIHISFIDHEDVV